MAPRAHHRTQVKRYAVRILYSGLHLGESPAKSGMEIWLLADQYVPFSAFKNGLDRAYPRERCTLTLQVIAHFQKCMHLQTITQRNSMQPAPILCMYTL